MRYKEYIASDLWQSVRAERLVFDNYKCVICHMPATSVHHLRYPETFGQEDIQNDLASVCEKHHRMLDCIERYERYSRRKYATVFEKSADKRMESRNELGRSKLQVSERMPDAHAQWANGKSPKQVVKVDQGDYVQERKNRR